MHISDTNNKYHTPHLTALLTTHRSLPLIISCTMLTSVDPYGLYIIHFRKEPNLGLL